MTEDRIDALLATCIGLPQNQWESGIERACEENPKLAPELRRRMARLLELGFVESESDYEAADGGRNLPERIGSFRLTRKLGDGGMGVVFEAWDEKLDRRVALKVIRSEQLFFKTARRRFAREVQAASRLDHPNICPIYEAGEVDGVPYLAMRFIEGESLADRLEDLRQRSTTSSARTDTRSATEFVLWVEKVARALHAAHEAGIIHRDVKPANILIDEAGEPQVVDFGLAAGDDTQFSVLTRSGERVGTPAYMAPEQITGGEVDRRTDVYALGTVLYECITLRLPFEQSSRESLYRSDRTPDRSTADSP